MAHNFPLVTIAAANFNNASYLLESLNSINNQTYENIELVIVDDGSTDDSIQLIQGWLKGFDKPFKFIIHEKNLGLCRTCNDLVRNANGKYLSFIATDDIYLRDKIKDQVEVLEASDDSVAMVYSDTYLMDSSGKRKFGTVMTSILKCNFSYYPSGNILNELQETHFVHWLSALIKTEIYRDVGLYDEQLSFEDYDMSLRVAKKYKIQFVDRIQSVYRVHSGSISGKTKDWNPLLLGLFIKHIDLPRFKIRAHSIILNAFLHGDKSSKDWAVKYFEACGEKIDYYNFVSKGWNPVIFKIVRFFRPLSKAK